MTRLRSLWRRAPAVAWLCAAVATGNALAWAVITPPIQVPDEIVHFGYVQYVAEANARPATVATNFSGEQIAIVQGVPFGTERKPTWDPRAARALRDRLALHNGLSRSDPGEAGSLSGNPPLYYAYAGIGYRLATRLDAIDRLLATRAMTALLAGAVAFFSVLFLLELLPGAPWAVAAGGLAVAFQPLLGFISGGVNSDAGIWVWGAVLLWLLARCFRRGLTPRRGLGIGVATLLGLATKLTIAGLLPGLAVGLVLLWRRAAPGEQRRATARAALLAAACIVVPAVLYVVINAAFLGRSLDAQTSGYLSHRINSATSISGQLSYTWQTFLPRLPSMQSFFDGYLPWHVYARGFIGRFGWFEYDFQAWVYPFAGALIGALGLLGARELWVRRDALRSRRAEAVTYLALVVGLLLFISVSAYRYEVARGDKFEQTRYLFTLLPLWGAVVALGVRGAGRRWGPALGAFVVVLCIGHSLFSMLLTLGRFYA